MSKGFMFLPGEFRKWGWYKNSNMVHMLIHLMYEANYQDGTYMGVTIKRGQLATGRKQLAAETGMTEREVRTCLERLTNDQQIVIQTTNRFSVITVCNYDSWHGLQKSNDQPSTSETPTDDQQSGTPNDHNNKDNKDIKDNIKEEESNDSKKKKFVYPQEYEDDFILYGRKGSKKNGYTRWKDLTEDEKTKMRKHIPYYLQSNDRQYLKDFEGYINQRLFESPVYKGSELLFDPVQLESPSVYSPLTDGILQWWDDKEKCLHFNGYIDMLDDGYTADNRPDGAKVKWQMYSWIWNASKKEWIKQ